MKLYWLLGASFPPPKWGSAQGKIKFNTHCHSVKEREGRREGRRGEYEWPNEWVNEWIEVALIHSTHLSFPQPQPTLKPEEIVAMIQLNFHILPEDKLPTTQLANGRTQNPSRFPFYVDFIPISSVTHQYFTGDAMLPGTIQEALTLAPFLPLRGLQSGENNDRPTYCTTSGASCALFLIYLIF